MRKLSCKDELTNIHNTLKPPASQKDSEGAGGGCKKTFTILAGIIVVVVGMGWVTGVWQSTGLTNGISFQREFGEPKKNKKYHESTSEPDRVTQKKGLVKVLMGTIHQSSTTPRWRCQMSREIMIRGSGQCV